MRQPDGQDKRDVLTEEQNWKWMSNGGWMEQMDGWIHPTDKQTRQIWTLGPMNWVQGLLGVDFHMSCSSMSVLPPDKKRRIRNPALKSNGDQNWKLGLESLV